MGFEQALMALEPVALPPGRTPYGLQSIPHGREEWMYLVWQSPPLHGYVVVWVLGE